MGKVRRRGNEKGRGGRKMYSGKLAPHKSGMQSCREEAVKNSRHADRVDGKMKNDVQKKKKWGDFSLDISINHNHCMSCTVDAQQHKGEESV